MSEEDEESSMIISFFFFFLSVSFNDRDKRLWLLSAERPLLMWMISSQLLWEKILVFLDWLGGNFRPQPGKVTMAVYQSKGI